MHLMASAVLAALTVLIVGVTAYKLANPAAPASYSKTVGWLAAASGMPFALASLYLASQSVAGNGFAVALGASLLVAAATASVLGEQEGLKAKANR